MAEIGAEAKAGAAASVERKHDKMLPIHIAAAVDEVASQRAVRGGPEAAPQEGVAMDHDTGRAAEDERVVR